MSVESPVISGYGALEEESASPAHPDGPIGERSGQVPTAITSEVVEGAAKMDSASAGNVAVSVRLHVAAETTTYGLARRRFAAMYVAHRPTSLAGRPRGSVLVLGLFVITCGMAAP